MSEDRTYQLIEKLLAGDHSEAERKAMLDEINASPEAREQYEILREFWEDKDDPGLQTFSPDPKNAWKKVKAKTIDADATPEGKIRSLYRQPWLRYAAAAVILLLIGFFTFYPSKEEINWVAIQTGPQETRSITLPDGSMITLNQQSNLSYPENFEVRTIRLDGEAYFDVKRDESRPFRVLAGNTQTTVLGTEFNIHAFSEDNQIDVWVVEGKVAVSLVDKTTEQVILENNEAAVWQAEENTLVKTGPVQWNANAWIDRELEFSDARLGDVAHSLSRYFRTTVKLTDPGLTNCRYTGSYEDPSLEEILQVLAFALDIEYKIESDTIKISGNGCE